MIKIVLADDHRIVREGIRLMLADEPDIEIVGEAENGHELLDLLGGEEADVVLLDVRMPGMSGLEALERLSEVAPGVRVVILSMHEEPTYVRRAVELGASGYLLKNTDRNELIKALQLVAGGSAYIQGTITGPLMQELREPSSRSGVLQLSTRDRDVLQLVAQGLTNKQIADEIKVSEATVRTYLKSIYALLQVNSRSEAVAVALREGIIE